MRCTQLLALKVMVEVGLVHRFVIIIGHHPPDGRSYASGIVSPEKKRGSPPPERRVIRVGGFHAQFADGHTGGDGQARVIGGRGEADRIFPDRLGTWVFDRAAEKDADAFIRRIVADDPERAHVFHADLARERQVDVFASGVGQRATGHVLRYVAALFDDMEAGGVELWVRPQVNPLHSRLPSRFRARRRESISWPR